MSLGDVPHLWFDALQHLRNDLSTVVNELVKDMLIKKTEIQLIKDRLSNIDSKLQDPMENNLLTGLSIIINYIHIEYISCIFKPYLL